MGYMAEEGPQIDDEFDRYRGIFDPRDRRLLAGVLDAELSERGKAYKRAQLRRRMKHALRDLAYLRLMSTDELADLIAASGPVETGGEKTRSADTGGDDPGDLLGESLLSLLLLTAELYPRQQFEHQLERYVARRAAIDHYVKTGTVGRFDVSVSTELTDELSITELETLASEHTEPPDTDQEALPPGAAAILELAADTEAGRQNV